MQLRVHAGDGSLKFIFPSGDGHVFEAAFFHVVDRPRPYIACVSTQVGCALGCEFCATRETGFVRQLTVAEILEQILAVSRVAKDRGARDEDIEISFMGMGEPLCNSRAVLQAVNAAHHVYSGMTRASLSTAGSSSAIRGFTAAVADASIPIHLQISLHATCDLTRRKLIPGSNDSIEHLLDAGAEYARRTGDHVCLNYVLLAGINDSDDDARWLSHLPPDRFYVKLTHLNTIRGLPRHLRSSSPERFARFVASLRESHVPFKVFRGDGLDVHASCGQLSARPVALYRSSEAPSLVAG